MGTTLTVEFDSLQVQETLAGAQRDPGLGAYWA